MWNDEMMGKARSKAVSLAEFTRLRRDAEKHREWLYTIYRIDWIINCRKNGEKKGENFQTQGKQ
jgi:hypothetical protein